MGVLFPIFSKQNNSSLSNDRVRQTKIANLPPQGLKHLWIRTALMEKLLDKIVLYLVENSRYCYDSLKCNYKPLDTLRVSRPVVTDTDTATVHEQEVGYE